MHMLKKNQFTLDESAVAGIIVAVMVVGLVLAVVSIIQTVYVPKWMESREAEHMGVVAGQFSQLKYTLDTHGVLKSSNPVSTPITLGSKDLGFLISQKAFGHVHLISNAYKIWMQTGGETSSYDYNILEYSSENAYFIDQTYTYEAGGVVLSQSDGMVLLIKPSVYASYNSGSPSTGSIVFTCYNLEPRGDQMSISGYGTYPIYTEYIDNISESKSNVNMINIYTRYPTLWLDYMDQLLTDAGFKKYINEETPYDYKISSVEEGDKTLVKIEFSGSYINVDVTVNTIRILTQIGPGIT